MFVASAGWTMIDHSLIPIKPFFQRQVNINESSNFNGIKIKMNQSISIKLNNNSPIDWSSLELLLVSLQVDAAWICWFLFNLIYWLVKLFGSSTVFMKSSIDGPLTIVTTGDIHWGPLYQHNNIPLNNNLHVWFMLFTMSIGVINLMLNE